MVERINKNFFEWIPAIVNWLCLLLTVLLYFLFSSTTDCMTHTGENISRPIISTSTASSVRRSTGTNFQKTIDISQPFTNQSGTFSFEFVTPYHMYERSPAVYQDKISTMEPKTTNGLSETMEAKGHDDNNMLV